MVMDSLTKLYRQTVRLRSDPEQLATIRWYFARPGAKPFPQGHAFGSSGWETESRPYPHAGIGEVFLPHELVPNQQPACCAGQRTPTPLEWFSTGVPAFVDSPLPNGRCCETAGVGWAPRAVLSARARAAAQLGAGQGVAGVQQFFPAGQWRQSGLIAVGWFARANQRAAGVQVGEAGVTWAALATSTGAGLQVGSVGRGTVSA